MAYRSISLNYGRSKLATSIFKIACNQKGFLRNTSSSATKPSVPFLGNPSCIFSVEALKHHWGAWPIVLTLVVGLAGELIGITYLAATRNDVWLTKGPAPCETVETRKGYKPPITKFKVINQKWEYSPQLLEAWQGSIDGPPPVDDEKDKKTK
ncbi:hypothetical protein ACLKA6_019893 [Drosophila palustris]